MKLIRLQILFVLALLYSCTHPYEPEVENTWNVEVEFSFIDPEFWPEGQQVKVGLFTDESNRFPIQSTAVYPPDANVSTVTMYDIVEGDYNAQLYLTENGVYKVKIADLGSYEVYNDLKQKAEAIKFVTFDRVQRQVLNGCVVCHGSSAGDIAANLNLTSGNSYEEMIGVKAFMQPAMELVYPGSSEYSYLMKVLLEEIDFNHAASSSATNADRQLVKDWIDEGALNN